MSEPTVVQAGGGLGAERMPRLAPAQMNEAQKKAAAELTAGPRGGVFGPFIPLMRSPELMDRLQKVGEYLRFKSSLDPRISEFLMLIVSREWTQQFEWFVHLPLALKAGVSADALKALEEGRRPHPMAPDETIAYDFADELARTRGVSETTYRRAVAQFGENGVIDMLGVLGYFTALSMVMNAVHSPATRAPAQPPLMAFPP